MHSKKLNNIRDVRAKKKQQFVQKNQITEMFKLINLIKVGLNSKILNYVYRKTEFILNDFYFFF